MKGRRRARRPVSIWKLVLADVLLLGVALVVFALFHHVLPRREQAIGLTSQRVSSAARPTAQPAAATVPAATATPEATATPAATAAPSAQVTATPEPTPEPTPEATPAPTPEPTPEPVGYFGSKFARKFTDGEVIATSEGYQSPNINITLNREISGHSFCFIADIYIKDISCFQTVFAHDTYGRGYAEHPTQMAKRVGSVLLINGDYYGTHNNGVVIRNGTLYRDDPKTDWDVCVLYWDGTMETFSPEDFDANREMERGAYQAWNFGPLLLDENGLPMEEFNTKVGGMCNPRTALGYIEPGHYCFVVVDGRSSRSSGMVMADLSQLMYQIGCKRAYNLDGGRSSMMMAFTSVVNHPYKDGRAVSDALVIVEPSTEEEASDAS